MSTSSSIPAFVDIGVNLTDDMYAGKYHGKAAHAADLASVMKRAQDAGVNKQMVTVGHLAEVNSVLDLTKCYQGLYCTAGVHPTRTSRLSENASNYIDELKAILDKDAIAKSNPGGKIIAIGECGLDYDRLSFSEKPHQLKHFELQLQLAKQYHLPLFLHCRAAHADFISILRPHLEAIAKVRAIGPGYDEDSKGRMRSGVVHCFTGSVEEMNELVELGLFIGLTGCSLKTQEGIDVARDVPLDRLLLETDAPWCDMRSTHASAPLLAAFTEHHPDLVQLYQPSTAKKEKWDQSKMVKGRNEPCTIGSIAAVISQAKGIAFEEVASAAFNNSHFLLGI
ncbi:hypothetical protein CBS101457_001533 [Exobasidium rhododendri]|nr:hypothetical protein CBS101457_001533 [Exobasidium rhododendri]